MKISVRSKVLGLLAIVGLLFVILPGGFGGDTPVGPLHFIWYGNESEGQTGGDLIGIVALIGLVIGLTVIFIRTVASAFGDLEHGLAEDEEEQSRDRSEDQQQHFHHSHHDRN
jgi:drug/metabolite transporter (DMT)-like permease